jgi:predicted HTH domain antitoxin
MKCKSYKDPKILKKLYWKEKLSTKKIAELFGVSRDTIEYWMEKFNIPRRHNNRKRPDISKEILEKLYWKKKLSMPRIAKLLKTTYNTIWHKMKKYGIKIRSISEAKLKYIKIPFSGNLIEKAYLLGLRAGDISAKLDGKQVTVITGTTHFSQVQMFKKVFEKYSPVKFYEASIKDGRKAWIVYCRLHPSFKFLLKKPNYIPVQILKNDRLFFSFLAGYADSEGCWNIYKQKDSKKARGRFQIISGDKTILKQLTQKLKKIGFKPLFGLSRKSGHKCKVGVSNLDMYYLSLNHQKDVLKLSKILIKYSKHPEKIWKMKFIMKNQGKNWEEVKDELKKFKEYVKSTNINNITRVPRSRLHDAIS